MSLFPTSLRPAPLAAFAMSAAVYTLLLPGKFALAKTPPKERAAPAARRLVGRQDDGSVLVTTNQIVTPLGLVKEVPFERPKDLAVSPDGSLIAVLTTAKVDLFKPDGTLVVALGIKPGPLGLACIQMERRSLPAGRMGWSFGWRRRRANGRPRRFWSWTRRSR